MNYSLYQLFCEHIDRIIPVLIIFVIGSFAFMFDYYNSYVPTNGQIDDISFSCKISRYDNIYRKYRYSSKMDCTAAQERIDNEEKWQKGRLLKYYNIRYHYEITNKETGDRLIKYGNAPSMKKFKIGDEVVIGVRKNGNHARVMWENM